MEVGTARYNLTPKGEFHLIGFRSENRYHPATGIHDDIFCNSLLFSDGNKDVFIFNADFLEFEESMVNEVKIYLSEKYNLEKDLILLSATHNHSSVVMYHKEWYTGKFDQKYYDFLLKTIEDSYIECKRNKREATARIGREMITGFYDNRNHPGELADNEVIVVKFIDDENTAFAAMVNWAVHSTVMSADNTMLTSELAGNVASKLAESYHFHPLMIVGAAGDCSNRNLRQGNDFNELTRVSTGLAAKILDIKVDKEIKLNRISFLTDCYHIEHDMKNVHHELKVEIRKLEKEASKYPDKYQGIHKRIKNLGKDFHINHFSIDVHYSVINIGGFIFYSFPGELGSGFGIELKRINCDAIVGGYTNGYLEYFMPSSEYGLSFETIGSKIPKGVPEDIIIRMIDMAENLIKY